MELFAPVGLCWYLDFSNHCFQQSRHHGNTRKGLACDLKLRSRQKEYSHPYDHCVDRREAVPQLLCKFRLTLLLDSQQFSLQESYAIRLLWTCLLASGAELCFFYQGQEVASRGYFVPNRPSRVIKISKILHWPTAVSQPAASKWTSNRERRSRNLSLQWWSLMVSSETADVILLRQEWGKRARMAQLYCPVQRIISIFPGADTWDVTSHS